MKIAMFYPNGINFGPRDHNKKGIGGSESSLIKTFEYLVQLGHTVHVFNAWDEREVHQNWSWQNLIYFNPDESYDVAYGLRHANVFDRPIKAKLKTIFLADTESVDLGNYVRDGKINLVMAVSNWQKEKIAKEENIAGDKWLVTSAGVEKMEGGWSSKPSKVKGRCVFMGTPDKGLAYVLKLWPAIREKVPYSTLHVYSSFMGWNLTEQDSNKHLVNENALMDQMKSLGVTNFKHGSAEAVRKAQLEAELYLYPTDFYETCCMCVLESMYCGCLPVTTSRAALIEKVVDKVTGYAVPAYDASSEYYASAFVDKTVGALQAADIEKQRLADNAYTYASQYVYEDLVKLWVQEWDRRIKK